MLFFIISFILILITFIMINIIIKKDTDKNIKKINELILDIIKEEKKEYFNIVDFKEKILEKCNDEKFAINDLSCEIKGNVLKIIYSYKNISRISDSELKMLIE